MRTLILSWFLAFFLWSINGWASVVKEYRPEKISMEPASVSTLENDDWSAKSQRFYLRFATGILGGRVLEVSQTTNNVYVEGRFNYRDSVDVTSSVALEVASMDILMLDLGKQWQGIRMGNLQTFYRFSFAPVFSPSEGMATLYNLKRAQIRAAFGSEDFWSTAQDHFRLGAEMAVGYSLLGFSYDAKLSVQF